MRKKLNSLLFLGSCFVAGSMIAVPIHAGIIQPPEWPWRGVNMDSISSTPEDIRVLVSQLGVNSVHLQVRPEKLGQVRHLNANAAWNQAVAWVDAMLDACKKNHIVGIVEVSGVPLGNVQSNTQATPAFWASSKEKQAYLQRLGSLAQDLRDHGGELAAYDIMSEPVMLVGGRAFRPPGWRKLQINIVQTLRHYDPNRWILVKPGPWGSPKGYKNYKPLNEPRLIYSVHMYDPHEFTHQGIKHYPLGPKFPGRIGSKMWDANALKEDVKPVINFQKKYQVPIYIGEFSAVRWAPGAGEYIKDLVQLFNSHNWGWAYFAYSGWNGWNPNYNSDYSANSKMSKRDYVGLSSKRWATLRAILPNKKKSN